MDQLTEMDIRWSLVHSLREALGMAEALMVLSSAQVTHPHGMDEATRQQRDFILGVSRRLCANELIKYRERVLAAFDNWSKTL